MAAGVGLLSLVVLMWFAAPSIIDPWSKGFMLFLFMAMFTVHTRLADVEVQLGLDPRRVIVPRKT